MLALGAAIGLIHGLLVTRLKVQAFVVTLCGLFIYRGIARWLSGDQVQGIQDKARWLKYWLYESKDVFGLPMSLVIFLILAAIATVFLHFSVYGRLSLFSCDTFTAAVTGNSLRPPCGV